MISIEINHSQLKRLIDATTKAKKGFKKELAAAVNQAAKKTRLDMGRQIRATVTLKKDESEKPISVRLNATEANLAAVVNLKKTPRLGLRHFGAKQDRRGVSYKISKTGGRSKILGAFMGPKPGVIKTSWRGNVFVREGAAVKASKGRHTGRMRQPIVQRFGVSAFGVYVKNNLTKPQVEAVTEELKKQIERRINLNVLRASGLVKK